MGSDAKGAKEIEERYRTSGQAPPVWTAIEISGVLNLGVSLQLAYHILSGKSGRKDHKGRGVGCRWDEKPRVGNAVLHLRSSLP